MKLSKITSIDRFADLKSGWNHLTTEPLRSFDWSFAWWQSFGEGCKLNIYCFELNGEVVGIAPLFVDRWMGQQRVRFLGSGSTCSDYAEIISLPEYRDAFVAAIAADIENSTTITMVELDGVCGAPEDELLCESLDNTFCRYERALEPTWILELPETWQQFVSHTHRSLRRKVNSATKRLQSGELHVYSTREQLDYDDAFDILVELHQERFISKGVPGVFSDERFSRFLRNATGELCKHQQAEILVGYLGDKPIGAQLYLHGKSGPQLYQSGSRTDSLKFESGHLLFTYAVRQAIENGFEKFDFLRGSEPYKSFWGAKPRPLWEIRLVSKNYLPTTIIKTYCFLRSIKHGYSSLMTRSLRNP